MLRRIITAVVLTVAVGATASAQDMKLPGIDFGRYNALGIGSNDFKTAFGPSIDVLAG